MSRPNYEKSEEELNDLPIDWERHSSRDTWAIIQAPTGEKITYHMSRRTYRHEGEQNTITAAPELMYKRIFLDASATVVPFGKYEGHSVEWLVENDRNYAEWLVGVANDWLREAIEEELSASESSQNDSVANPD